MKIKTRPVKLPVELVERLKAMRRPHQAIAGVIEELLDKIDRLKAINSNTATNKET